MYSVWTKHVRDDEDKKKQFENSVTGSKSVLDRAVAILREQESALAQSELSDKAYNLPNWDYRQAHNNGLRAGLMAAIKLLDLDKQTKGIIDPNDKFAQ